VVIGFFRIFCLFQQLLGESVTMCSKKQNPILVRLFLALSTVFLLSLQAFAVSGSNGDQALYIVQLTDAPLIGYNGEIPGLEATNPAVTGAKKLNVHSPSSQAYAAFLDEKQSAAVNFISNTVSNPEVVHSYKYAYNGLAVRMTAAEARAVAKQPGVLKVFKDFERKLHRQPVKTQSYALPATSASQSGLSVWSVLAVTALILGSVFALILLAMKRKKLGRLMGIMMIMAVFAVFAGCDSTEDDETDVPAANLMKIILSPADASIPAGSTTTVTAKGRYGYGSDQTLAASSLTWASSDESVATVSSSGVITGVADGSVTISATKTDKTDIVGELSYTVTDAQIVSFTISPSSATSYRHYDEAKFTATGTFTDGSTADVSTTVTWTSSDSAIDMQTDGTANAISQVSNVTVTATYGDESHSATVDAEIFKSFTMSPLTATVKRGQTKQFTAILEFTDDTTADVTEEYWCRWRVEKPYRASITSNGSTGNGTVKGLREGVGETTVVYPVWYGYDWYVGNTDSPVESADKATLTISDAELQSLTITPSSTSIPVGAAAKFEVIGTYDDGDEVVTKDATFDVSGDASWDIDSGLDGSIKGTSAGDVTVTAHFDGQTADATLEVTDETLHGIVVKPGSRTMAVDQYLQYMAIGKYYDATEESTRDVDITDMVTWDVTDDTKVTIQAGYDATDDVLSGRAQAVAVGSTVVRAQLDGKTGTANVTVIDETEVRVQGGYAWIGARGIWDGDDVSTDLKGSMGEGIVVGVIDTGINPYSPSFAEVGGDGYQHINPKGKYFGVCDPEEESYDSTFPCNDKLIGAWGYDDPYDVDGHGSHTAGTAAGNIIYDAAVYADNGFTVRKDIAGVAPHANIISYNACCALSNLLAAMDQIIIDGVDVVNYSIGGGARNPWDEPDALAYLDARDAGIFVATSAGNSGPDESTLGSPGDAPWILTVAASSHNYTYQNTLTDMTADGPVATLADITGYAYSNGYGPKKIVYAGDYGNPLCLEGEFQTWFDGAIVVCDRGQTARVSKGQAVKDAGGGGFVLAEVSEDGGLGAILADNHVIPALHIKKEDGDILKEWLADGATHWATIGTSTMVADSSQANILAAFSSRGPNPSVADIIKPDITGPGRSIFAPYCGNNCEDHDGPVYYNIISGTSMSSPHLAGAAALIKGVHNDWTPGMIQSAMMLTADYAGHKKDQEDTSADAFDIGAGQIDLSVATKTPLVLEESKENYLKANPEDYWESTDDTVGIPSSLNIASLGNGNCVTECSWTRTFSNVTATATGTYTVDASNITSGLTLTATQGTINVAGDGTADLEVTANVSGITMGEWAFGTVTLTHATHPDIHLPVAVKAASGSVPSTISISTDVSSDTKTYNKFEGAIDGSNALEISERGLVKGTEVETSLDSDPTNGDAYDGFDGQADGAMYTTVTVSGAERFVIEIVESESQDLDLFVGTGSTPSASTQVASAATGAALEYLNIEDPDDGTYWILVQNWEEGHTASAIKFVHAVVTSAGAGNMTITPSSTTSSPFSIDFAWSGLTEGHWYGSFGMRGTNDAADYIGKTDVNLEVTE
jgi:subtilisin family serine protease